MANFFEEIISPYGKYSNALVEIDNLVRGGMPQGMGMPNVPSLDQLRRTYLFRELFKDDYNKLAKSEEGNNNNIGGYQSQVLPVNQQGFSSLEDILRNLY